MMSLPFAHRSPSPHLMYVAQSRHSIPCRRRASRALQNRIFVSFGRRTFPPNNSLERHSPCSFRSDVCRAVSALYSVPTEGVQSVAESYLRVVWQADVSTEQFLGAQLALLLRFVGRFLVVGWFFGCGAST